MALKTKQFTKTGRVHRTPKEKKLLKSLIKPDDIVCGNCNLAKWACQCGKLLTINNTHLEVLENCLRKGLTLQDALDIAGIKYITYNHFEKRYPEVREKREQLMRERKRKLREASLDTFELAVKTDPKYALEFLKMDKESGFQDETKTDSGNQITVNLVGDYKLETDGKSITATVNPTVVIEEPRVIDVEDLSGLTTETDGE